jgi:allantoinase
MAAGTSAYDLDRPCPLPKARKEYNGDIFAIAPALTGMQSFAPLMYTLPGRARPAAQPMARLCSEETGALTTGSTPEKGGIRSARMRISASSETGDFIFDERIIRDREDARWSPYHGRAMKARVAATILRGSEIWNGTEVKAKPGTGRFVPRQHRHSALDS